MTRLRALAATRFRGVPGWVIALGGGLVIAAVAVTLVATTTGGGPTASDASAGAGAPRPEQRCVGLWNRDSSVDGGRSELADLLENGVTLSDVYVSVGFSSDLPDKCLLNFAISFGGGYQLFQYMQGTSQGPLFAENGGAIPLAQADASLKQWNARLVSKDGRVALS
jgi:hypothetical protein